MADPPPSDVPRLRRALIQQLESLQRSGVTVIGRSQTPDGASAAAVPEDSVRPSPPAAGRRTTTARSAGAGRAPAGGSGPEPVTPEVKTPAAGPKVAPTPQTGESKMPDQPSPQRPQPKGDSTASLFDQAPQGPVLSLAERQQKLQQLCREVATCTKCGELVANRTKTVFGVGNPQPRLCFFGEAPGADEDRQGEPFVGRAGQLLNKIIEACGMRREDVYILNVLKCRPPNNRDPAVEEVSHCRGYFERQMEILRPEFICCLGKPAMSALLGTPPSVSLGRMRGQFHRYRGSQVLVTYHPAYLLRNPAAKRDTWEDMQLLMREMGIEIPKQGRK